MTNKAFIAQLKGKMKSRKEAGDDVWLDLERAAAALEAQEWQPIATAPKDGTEIMFFDVTTENVGVCWNVNGFWLYGDDMDGEGFYPSCNPTHWRPLPPAPKGE